MHIFDWLGVFAPNPHVVRGSNVFQLWDAVPEENSYSILTSLLLWEEAGDGMHRAQALVL